MCSINFVREFGLMMEESRKEYLGCRERMLWVALFYIANQRAQGNYNALTQTYEWPEGFFPISHEELGLYCKLNKKAILEMRNRLKQRGYIDFVKGERNADKPMYRLNYLSLLFGGENSPKTTPNAGPKEGTNAGPKEGTNAGPIHNKYKYNSKDRIHTPIYGKDTAREAGMYLGLDGLAREKRYDDAWTTSAKARGAVAQRILYGFRGTRPPGADLHGYIMGFLEMGMPPEVIEDVAENAMTGWELLAKLSYIANQRGYTREEIEARKITDIQGRYPQLAAMIDRRETEETV